jgi:hypothetical protein
MSPRAVGAQWSLIAAFLCFMAPLPIAAQTGAAVVPPAPHDHAVRSSLPAEPAVTALLDSALHATEPFRDRNLAIAAGYRRLGMDFPSMGEHWVSPRLVIEGKFDIARPAMLTYVVVNDHPVLTGLVYAIPLSPGESPPGAFGVSAIWHEHNGTVDEESLVPEHHATPAAALGTRLAILHAWIGVLNPGGTFSAENWALPFVRLGLAVPDRFPPGAARALSLLSGARAYFTDLADAPDTASGEIHAVLDECATRASKVLATARANANRLDAADLAELDHAWSVTLEMVSRISGPESAKRINGGSLPTAMGK